MVMAIRQKLSALQQPSLQTMINGESITPAHPEKLLGVTIKKILGLHTIMGLSHHILTLQVPFGATPHIFQN